MSDFREKQDARDPPCAVQCLSFPRRRTHAHWFLSQPVWPDPPCNHEPRGMKIDGNDENNGRGYISQVPYQGLPSQKSGTPRPWQSGTLTHRPRSCHCLLSGKFPFPSKLACLFSFAASTFAVNTDDTANTSRNLRPLPVSICH